MPTLKTQLEPHGPSETVKADPRYVVAETHEASNIRATGGESRPYGVRARSHWDSRGGATCSSVRGGASLAVRRRLDAVQLSVLAALRHERFVRSGLDDARTIEHDDQVGHSHRREAM